MSREVGDADEEELIGRAVLAEAIPEAAVYEEDRGGCVDGDDIKIWLG